MTVSVNGGSRSSEITITINSGGDGGKKGIELNDKESSELKKLLNYVKHELEEGNRKGGAQSLSDLLNNVADHLTENDDVKKLLKKLAKEIENEGKKDDVSGDNLMALLEAILEALSGGAGDKVSEGDEGDKFIEINIKPKSDRGDAPKTDDTPRDAKTDDTPKDAKTNETPKDAKTDEKKETELEPQDQVLAKYGIVGSEAEHFKADFKEKYDECIKSGDSIDKAVTTATDHAKHWHNHRVDPDMTPAEAWQVNGAFKNIMENGGEIKSEAIDKDLESFFKSTGVGGNLSQGEKAHIQKDIKDLYQKNIESGMSPDEAKDKAVDSAIIAHNDRSGGTKDIWDHDRERLKGSVGVDKDLFN